MAITKRTFLAELKPSPSPRSKVAVFAFRPTSKSNVTRSFVLPLQEWSDMGCPDKITITLELGDKVMEK